MRAVKQPGVENRPIQNGQDRDQRGRVSRCRMDSLAGFHCRAGAGPVKESVSKDQFRS